MSRTLPIALLVVATLVAPFAARAEEPASAADKAAAAAQRAAEAAEKAADAAARSAAAVEKMTAASAAPDSAKAKSPKPAEPPAAPPPQGWTGTVGLGLISLTGNSQSLTFKATGAFEHKSNEWIWGVKANAVYGQQQAAGASTSSVSALGGEVQLRGDKRFTQQLSVYVLGGIFSDHIASIEDRPYIETGVSLIWFDNKEPVEGTGKSFDKTSLKTDLGFRYGHEYRFQYYPTQMALPGVDIIAPHAGLAYRYAINKDIIFTQDADLVANLVGDARLLLTTLSKLSSRLTAAVSLGVSFGVSYDSVPAAGRKNTDTALTVGLEVAL